MTWREFDVDGVPYRQDEQTGETQRWVVAGDGGFRWLPVAIERPQERREAAQAAPVDVRRIEAPAAPVQTVQRVSTSRTDQAWGFTIKTSLLALVAAVALPTLRYGLTDAPFVWGGAFAWFWATFAGTWLIAFVVDLAISPDGIMWMHTRKLWAYYEREQRHRMERDQ